MIVYELGGPEERVFKTLKECRAYIKTQGYTDYYIDRCKMAKPTVDVLIDVINSEGGCWAISESETVEAKGSWAHVDTRLKGKQ